MARNLVLRKQEFRNWLASQGDGLAGTGRDRVACPVATYLYGKTGQTWFVSARVCIPTQARTESMVTMIREKLVAFVHPKEFRTPKWAREFIMLIDGESKHQAVRAKRALYLLDEAIH